ncbi:MAG: CHASE2 domain-containing protein [Zymomonas mobilis subsp. pomaceae]|uniref:CHASE2 domain-containing protein n=1 Tax=Zymomonas mobilis TaxID=542 RepID=UPI0039ED11A3
MNDVLGSLKPDTSARDYVEPELKDNLAFEWWLISFAATLAVIIISWAGMTYQLDLLFYDAVVRLGYHKPDPSILIVKIDNNALKTIGPWPWTPDKHAQFIKQLNTGHPTSIGYNVLFLDPSESKARDDLSKTLKTSPAPIFLPMLVESGGHNNKTVAIVPSIASSATAVGHVSLPFDGDGIVRRYWPALSTKGRYWPALVALMDNNNQHHVFSDQDLTEQLFTYDGPSNRFPAISAAAIWRNEVPPEFLAGKRILVGVTASGFEDLHPTPFGIMPGVEIQANILDNLLNDRSIKEASNIVKLIVDLLSLWTLLIGFRFLSPRLTILLTAILGCGVPFLSGLFFLFGNFWIPPITSVVAVIFTYPFWAWSRLASLSKYFSYELEKLWGDTSPMKLQSWPEITATDPLEYKKQLLRLAISRIIFMRRFISDSLYYLPDAFFVTDQDNNIILANKAAEKLATGLGAQSSYKTPISELLNHFHNEEGHLINLDQVKNNEISSQCYAEDGRAFDLRVAACRKVEGQPDGSLVMLVDISAVRAAEEQRQRILHLLSHDMRSPQISILALIDTFSRTPCSKEADAQEIISKISGYARRTLGLADNFTRLAQAEAPEYQWMDVEIGGVMTSAVDELWVQAHNRHIQINLNEWDEPLFVKGDPSLLERTFINLIDNAVKYSPEGSSVSCSIKEKGEQVEISICDKGIGMDQAQVEALFRPFSRATAGPASKISGIGLGLVFVNKVILRHHGHIICKTAPGEGTCFIVTLPLIL